MSKQIYQLSYDDVIDQDIHNWLESLDRNRKAELVRHAIRYYINYNGKEVTPTLLPPVTKASEPSEKKRPKLGMDGRF